MSFLEGATHHVPAPCPWCGEPNDRALSTGEDDRPPRAGDVGLCMSCIMPMIYQEVGKPRVPTDSEWMTINENDNITQLRREVFMSRASLEGSRHEHKGTTVMRGDE